MLCTVIMKEVIHHYTNEISNVYCCILGASRAFDETNYGKLFSILLQRNINVYCILLIVDGYVRQISRVFPGEITILNILSYQMESNKVEYLLPLYLTFIYIYIYTTVYIIGIKRIRL